jgi:hypothetical protein
MDQRRWRADKTGKVFRRLASDVNRYRGSSIDRVATLVAVALDGLGGVTGFTRLWYEHLNRASAQGNFDIVLRQLNFIADLMLAIEQPRRIIDRETLNDATDEELVAERNIRNRGSGAGVPSAAASRSIVAVAVRESVVGGCALSRGAGGLAF